MATATKRPGKEITMEVRGVTKRFGENIAVNNVTFDVLKGEVLGFLGPNGSGKTTTMRLMTSFYTPDSGKIIIDGVDNQVDDVYTRNKIGYLPENNPNWGDMLASEYLKFVAELRGLSSPERRDGIDQAVYETGIEEVYNKPINQCSKGYKQRIALAGVILHKPEILIMDEPTEGLDPNQRVPVRDLIRRLGRERTVLLSTHVLQEVEAVCNRILMISKGRIVAQGRLDELRHQARGDHAVRVEVEGDRVEARLKAVKGVSSVRREDPIEGRKRYSLSVASGTEIRPLIYDLAKRNGWVVWDLHQDEGRLEDLFYSLTMYTDSLLE